MFRSDGWQSWELSARPLIPDGMPILVEDDLRFCDDLGILRPAAAINDWLRELPLGGCRSPRSWVIYARVLRDWADFVAGLAVALFDTRDRLEAALESYAEYRLHGPSGVRFKAATWSRHAAILSSFYRWARATGHTNAEPFTYEQAMLFYSQRARSHVKICHQGPRREVACKYLERERVGLFLQVLRDMGPDESGTWGQGLEAARNGAVGALAAATGLRRQEFSYLLAAELPLLPPRPSALPIPFPVPAGLIKGGKPRTSWITYDALAEAHQYCRLKRTAAVDASEWQPPSEWGPPLMVTEADDQGGVVNGRRVSWSLLRPAERRRLVAPGGGSMLLAVCPDGSPFSAWRIVFARTSDQIRQRFDSRFPTVSSQCLRHSFAIATLEQLVNGSYSRAARLLASADEAGGPDVALARVLVNENTLRVLCSLLGHASVQITEAYVRRLDVFSLYRDVYECVSNLGVA